MTGEIDAKKDAPRRSATRTMPVLLRFIFWAQQYNYVTVLLQGKNGQSEFRVKGNLKRVWLRLHQFDSRGKEVVWEEESGLFCGFLLNAKRALSTFATPSTAKYTIGFVHGIGNEPPVRGSV